jgi:hypothetical protein
VGYAGLAAWLRAHHLADGLSGYHQANVVTLETGGAVRLRPVAPGADGRLAAYAWNASSAWYDPAARTATFLVLADRGFATPGNTGRLRRHDRAGHRHVRAACRELPV